MSVSNGLAVMSVKTRQLSPQRWGKLVTSLLVAALLLQLTACGDESPRVLGTVERDRLTLTAPVGELINRINVVEGQQVQAGEVLLELDSTAAQARLSQRQAELKQAQAKLAEAVTGARSEDIDKARAALDGANASVKEAQQSFERTQRLFKTKVLSQADLDAARAARDRVLAMFVRAGLINERRAAEGRESHLSAPAAQLIAEAGAALGGRGGRAGGRGRGRARQSGRG
mgnify:CR=1 FL=1